MLPLLLLVLAGTEAVYRPLIFGRPKGGFLQQGADGDGYTWTNASYMVYDTITQVNDHFGNVTGSWQQRYQYNRKFFNPQRPLAFLMLGGEGEIGNGGDKWVRNENITMMQYAQMFGAAAFQVEHRFYGPKNCTPVGDTTVNSYQLLTIEQALADVDDFIGQMNNKYFKLNSNIKWITFGGSYPGTLSALFRATYPQRTIGAVSTSSAVHFFTDYYGYAVNTEYTYRTVSPSCADNIGIGFQKMINLAYGGAAGRTTLQKTFNLCNSFDNSSSSITKAVQYFFSNYYGLFQGINQYTGDNRDAATRTGLGVPGACAIMNNASYGDEMQRIKAVYDWQGSFHNQDPNLCADNSYDGYIKWMQDTTYSDLEQVGARSWVWQTCTSLGYFQTTDGNNGIFGSTVPLDFYADQCSSIFGPQYDLLSTFNQVNAYRSYFYDTYKGTKVVFPNGSFDPWKSLGFPISKADAANDVDAFMINGTAHCANMYPARSEDNQSLKDARLRIQDHLDNWIKIGFSAVTQAPTVAPPASTTQKSKTLFSVLPSICSFFLIYFL